MKLRTVWIIFFLSVFSLLAFQAVWLSETYKLKKKEMQDSVNSQFVESVEEELKGRLEKSNLEEEEMLFLDDNAARAKMESEPKIFEVKGKDVFETGIFQYLLHFFEYPFRLSDLDSVFQDKLAFSELPLAYVLTFKDSTGIILEQTGDLSSSRIEKAFRTDSLLIVDGKRVQAIVDISPSVIFKRMIWLLGASFLMLVIILVCIIYQAKTIFTQYKLNRLREDFTNALTHDMKTPLGTINTVLSLFRDGTLEKNPDMREKFGKTAMDQVSGLLMLVEKILTIAKMEEGKLELERTPVDLLEIANELKNRFSLSKEKQVTILTSVELGDRIAYLDRTLIKDAIANLMENAIKYSGASVRIELDCYVENKQLFIRVRDNGLGISEKDKQKIFEKFERGAAVGRKGAKGFGLGLNYVKRVTEAHGGIVVLYSKEKEGSEFTMVLPTVDSVA
jgi:two-component system phosphate regulon sensor histidine kinase PhoR